MSPLTALCKFPGDISPETVQGKFVGVICASLGVAILAIPAGIFISGITHTTTVVFFLLLKIEVIFLSTSSSTSRLLQLSCLFLRP
jgi:hypothetical protein